MCTIQIHASLRNRKIAQKDEDYQEHHRQNRQTIPEIGLYRMRHTQTHQRIQHIKPENHEQPSAKSPATNATESISNSINTV